MPLILAVANSFQFLETIRMATNSIYNLFIVFSCIVVCVSADCIFVVFLMSLLSQHGWEMWFGFSLSSSSQKLYTKLFFYNMLTPAIGTQTVLAVFLIISQQFLSEPVNSDILIFPGECLLFTLIQEVSSLVFLVFMHFRLTHRSGIF